MIPGLFVAVVAVVLLLASAYQPRRKRNASKEPQK